jgi:hypothetical protein
VWVLAPQEAAVVQLSVSGNLGQPLLLRLPGAFRFRQHGVRPLVFV